MVQQCNIQKHRPLYAGRLFKKKQIRAESWSSRKERVLICCQSPLKSWTHKENKRQTLVDAGQHVDCLHSVSLSLQDFYMQRGPKVLTGTLPPLRHAAGSERTNRVLVFLPGMDVAMEDRPDHTCTLSLNTQARRWRETWPWPPGRVHNLEEDTKRFDSHAGQQWEEG